jgi:hypothetical protein|tara:strand:+ start:511 stop:660 length:150 start_codon:yes stop_codon:yes gene_type:complete
MIEKLLLDLLFLVVVAIFLAMALIPFYKDINDEINRKFEQEQKENEETK